MSSLLPPCSFSAVPAAPHERAEIAALLARCGLGREHSRLETGEFFVVREQSHVAACAAIDRQGEVALLRSVAVDPARRAEGLGRAVVLAALHRALEAGVREVWLRSEDAQDYWALHGFRIAPSQAAPAALLEVQELESQELDGRRGAPATLMRLDLSAGLLVRPAEKADMAQVLAIYNHEVRTSTSTYQYAERTLEEQVGQWELKRSDGHGFFVATTLDGRIAGYATYGLFRPREGWRFTCEHSVYLHADWRGRGVGKLLMAPVMAHARWRGFHVMVGVVDASNEASVRLHRSLGFDVAGIIKEGGYKFDRWLDVALLQARL